MSSPLSVLSSLASDEIEALIGPFDLDDGDIESQHTWHNTWTPINQVKATSVQPLLSPRPPSEHDAGVDEAHSNSASHLRSEILASARRMYASRRARKRHSFSPTTPRKKRLIDKSGSPPRMKALQADKKPSTTKKSKPSADKKSSQSRIDQSLLPIRPSRLNATSPGKKRTASQASQNDLELQSAQKPYRRSGCEVTQQDLNNTAHVTDEVNMLGEDGDTAVTARAGTKSNNYNNFAPRDPEDLFNDDDETLIEEFLNLERIRAENAACLVAAKPLATVEESDDLFDDEDDTFLAEVMELEKAETGKFHRTPAELETSEDLFGDEDVIEMADIIHLDKTSEAETASAVTCGSPPRAEHNFTTPQEAPAQSDIGSSQPSQLPMKPFFRPFVPPPSSSDTSPNGSIVSPTYRTRTCFRIGEALQHISYAFLRPGIPSVKALTLEIYAILQSFKDVDGITNVTLADIFFPDKPPVLVVSNRSATMSMVLGRKDKPWSSLVLTELSGNLIRSTVQIAPVLNAVSVEPSIATYTPLAQKCRVTVLKVERTDWGVIQREKEILDGVSATTPRSSPMSPARISKEMA